jgi:glycosyltransferase involved in cell wall biosynthesis
MNRPSGLDRCLKALLSGDMLPAEIVIVDQSDDGSTHQLIEGYQDYSIPLVYFHQRQRGLSASRNAAFTHARCPIVAVTDDDCVPAPGWVKAIQSAFASPISPDAVTGRVLPLGPDIAGLYATSSRSGVTARQFTGKVIPIFVGTGGNFAARREWIQRVNGFDERLGAGSPGKAAEDIDIFYRLLRAGARIWYEPQVLVYHQRQTEERYQASRYSYGFGMGAFCGIWFRRGDIYSLRILVYLVRNQSQSLLKALRYKEFRQAENRKRFLAGIAFGFRYGFNLYEPQDPLTNSLSRSP